MQLTNTSRLEHMLPGHENWTEALWSYAAKWASESEIAGLIFEIDRLRFDLGAKEDWLWAFRKYPPSMFLEVFADAAAHDERLEDLCTRVAKMEQLLATMLRESPSS